MVVERAYFDVTVPDCSATSYSYANARTQTPRAAVLAPESFTLGAFEASQVRGRFPVDGAPFEPLDPLRGASALTSSALASSAGPSQSQSSTSSSSPSPPYGAVVKGWQFVPPESLTRSPFLYPSPLQVRQVKADAFVVGGYGQQHEGGGGNSSSGGGGGGSGVTPPPSYNNLTNATLAADGYSCGYTYQGSTSASLQQQLYPAQFIDMCTVLCFLDDNLTSSPSTSEGTCGEESGGEGDNGSSTDSSSTSNTSSVDPPQPLPPPQPVCCYSATGRATKEDGVVGGDGHLTCANATTAPLSVVFTRSAATAAWGSSSSSDGSDADSSGRVTTASAGAFTIVGPAAGLAAVDAWAIFEGRPAAIASDDGTTLLPTVAPASAATAAIESARRLLRFNPSLPFAPSEALPIFAVDQIVAAAPLGSPLTSLKPFAVSLVDGSGAPVGKAFNASGDVPPLLLWVSRVTRVNTTDVGSSLDPTVVQPSSSSSSSVVSSLTVPQPRERLMASSQAERRPTAPSSCFPPLRPVALVRTPPYYAAAVNGSLREAIRNSSVNGSGTVAGDTAEQQRLRNWRLQLLAANFRDYFAAIGTVDESGTEKSVYNVSQVADVKGTAGSANVTFCADGKKSNNSNTTGGGGGGASTDDDGDGDGAAIECLRRRLAVPHRYERNGTTVAFSDPWHPNAISSPIVGGVAQFVNLSLVFPAAGTYVIELSLACAAGGGSSGSGAAGGGGRLFNCPFFGDDQSNATNATNGGSSSVPQWRATVRVHVLPGQPARLCLWSSFATASTRGGSSSSSSTSSSSSGSGSSGSNSGGGEGLLDPSPRLLLLDASNNVFQPMRREARISANRYYAPLDREAFAQSVAVQTTLQRRVYDARFDVVDASYSSSSTSSQAEEGAGGRGPFDYSGLPPVPSHVLERFPNISRDAYYEWETVGTLDEDGDPLARDVPSSYPFLLSPRLFSPQKALSAGCDESSALPSFETLKQRAFAEMANASDSGNDTTPTDMATTIAPTIAPTPTPTTAPPAPNDLPFALPAPLTEYAEDNGVGVMQIQLRSVTVSTVFGVQYRLVFYSPRLAEANAMLLARLPFPVLVPPSLSASPLPPPGTPPAVINGGYDGATSGNGGGSNNSNNSTNSSAAIIVISPFSVGWSLEAPTPRFLLYRCSPSDFAVRGTELCLNCPSGSDHCHGGLAGDCFRCDGTTVLTLRGNYWRYAWYSLHAYACPADSCIGGGGGSALVENDAASATNETAMSDAFTAAAELATCAEGYRQGSALCNECVDGYAKDFLDQCLQCPPMWVSAVLILIIAILAVVVLFFFILISLKDMDEGEEADENLVVTIKIFVNFVQVTSMLGEFKVNFPAFVLSYFDFVAASSGSAGISINPINCLFPSLTFLEKMDAQLLLPIAILAAFGLLLVLQNRRRWHQRERRLRPTLTDDLYANPKTGRILDNPRLLDARRRATLERPLLRVFGNASMILLFLTYQSIAAQCIKVYDCITLIRSDAPGDVVRLLRSDTRVECDGYWYEAHMGIAMYGLLGYAFLIPATAVLFVQRVATYEGWSAARLQFSFLIRGFRLKFWWWEMVIVFRKIVLLLLLALVEDTVLQALLGIWFLTLSFVVQTFARPFVKRLHNFGEQLSLLTALVTLNIGLAFRTQESDSGERCGSVCRGFSVVLIFLNVAAMLVFLILIAADGYAQLVEIYGIDSAYGTRWFSLRNAKNHLLGLILRRRRPTPNFATYTPAFTNEAHAAAVFGGRIPNTNPRRRRRRAAGGEGGEGGGTNSSPLLLRNKLGAWGGGVGGNGGNYYYGSSDDDHFDDDDEAFALGEDPDVVVRCPDTGKVDVAATLRRQLWKRRVLDGMVVDENGKVVLRNKDRYLTGGGGVSALAPSIGGGGGGGNGTSANGAGDRDSPSRGGGGGGGFGLGAGFSPTRFFGLGNGNGNGGGDGAGKGQQQSDDRSQQQHQQQRRGTAAVGSIFSALMQRGSSSSSKKGGRLRGAGVANDSSIFQLIGSGGDSEFAFLSGGGEEDEPMVPLGQEEGGSSGVAGEGGSPSAPASPIERAPPGGGGGGGAAGAALHIDASFGGYVPPTSAFFSSPVTAESTADATAAGVSIVGGVSASVFGESQQQQQQQSPQRSSRRQAHAALHHQPSHQYLQGGGGDGDDASPHGGHGGFEANPSSF